ncbi:GNAT family N-acetyltransferase [uncultured Olleya sp.]|uniref:GNAT family N-acetyltransferase n=1 Tax=uncultured Olleya sp. TaxID=757243 RepID=UPI0025984F9B|nr:GNAT family N-acetyltransferase [uncultured Olleya sp.]
MIDSTIKIIPFDPKLSQQFYDLNIEWLERYFIIEDYDRAVLSQPQKYIIDKGGFIFFGLLNHNIIGTYAFMPLKNEPGFELTKMSVAPDYRGFKIGQQLLTHSIAFAKQQNFKKLLLYSSTKLENAIYLYRKFGFEEIVLEADSPYQRADIKMEYDLNV